MSSPDINDLDNAIAVLGAQIGEQFQISGRLEAKGRQAFAVAVAFYGAAQAAAFSTFAVTSVQRGEKLALLAVALVATVALAVVALLLLRSERTRAEQTFSPERLVAWFEHERAHYVSEQLVQQLALISQQRIDSNVERAAGHRRVVVAVNVALLLVGVEACLAIAVRT
jgi:hypothetical protein